MRWISGIFSVSIWSPLCVIQALKTKLHRARPVLDGSAACTTFFAFFFSNTTTMFNTSSITTTTPLGRILQPLSYKIKENMILVLGPFTTLQLTSVFKSLHFGQEFGKRTFSKIKSVNVVNEPSKEFQFS